MTKQKEKFYETIMSDTQIDALLHTFTNCTSLETVVIPSTVTNLRTSHRAFAGCSSLKTVIFNGDAPVMYEYGKGLFPGQDPFDQPRDTLTFYYKEGTSGWTTPTWKGYRCYPLGSDGGVTGGGNPGTGKTVGQTSGQVIGQVLATDIRAYINGAEIPAYNIDGKLAIVVSDLNSYGFKTRYDNSLHKTTVTRDKSAKDFTSVPSKASGLPIGTPVMSVLSSDIVVELDGRQVQAFNVDNRMAIYFTELKGYGDYGYDNAARASRLTLKK